MATYCFTREDTGEPVDMVLSWSEFDSARQEDGSFIIRGRKYRHDFANQVKGFRATPSNWPILSDAVGVAPGQVPEFQAKLRESGVSTEYTPDGRAILTSPLHRKRHCETLGYYDLNGGYSDPQRKNG